LSTAFRDAILADALDVVPVDDLLGTPTEIKTQPQEIDRVESVPPVIPAPDDSGAIAAESDLLTEDFASPSPVQSDDEVDQPQEEERPKRRRRLKWWQIVIVVVGLIFFCLLGLAIVDRIREHQQSDEPTTQEVDPTQAAEALRSAQEWVDGNPEDPYAYLALSAALWDSEQFDDATTAFLDAIRISDYDYDVIIDGCDIMRERKIYVGMATFLLNLHTTHPDIFTDELNDRFREAAYFAAEDSTAEADIPIVEIAEVDKALEQIVKGRYLLYEGDPDQAQAIAEDVLRNMQPDMPEAMLLQAEISIKTDNSSYAEQVLIDLNARGENPNWVDTYANVLLDFIKQGDDALGWLRQQIEENPEEPQYQLDLAAALFDLGKTEEGNDAVRQALSIAKGDQEVVSRALDMLAERGMWTGITNSLLTYQNKHPENFTDELHNRLAESAYFAAELPGSEDGIPISKIADVDAALERVIQGRYNLIHESPEAAQAIVDVVNTEMDAGMPEAQLLQAEIYMKSGDQDQAGTVLTDLKNREDIPEWVKKYVDILWSELGEDAGGSQNLTAGASVDAWSHVELLDASLAKGDFAEAENQVNSIMENAGDDHQVYFSTGETLFQYGVWNYAAVFYIRSADLMSEPTDEVIERIHMSAYFSALMEDGYEVLSNPDVSLSEELLQVVKTRSELYFGDYSTAAEAIQTLLEKDPYLDEEMLLEAERLIVLEEYDTAKEILKSLSEDDTKAFWIIEEASNLLANINQ